MIKLALKHWIFEKCIDVLFNSLRLNFGVGQKFKKLEHVNIGDTFQYIMFRGGYSRKKGLCKCYNPKIVDPRGSFGDFVIDGSHLEVIDNKGNIVDTYGGGYCYSIYYHEVVDFAK